MEEALAQSDPHSLRGPVARWFIAQWVTRRRAYLTEHPIEGVSDCVRHGLVAPDWLADAFIHQYDKVLNYRVATWDEAFGRANPPGKHLLTLRLRRFFTMRVQALFEGEDALPRTMSGRKMAASTLGISEKQVRSLLSTTRLNTRGHKPQKVDRKPSLSAHDPFSMTKRSVPKK